MRVSQVRRSSMARTSKAISDTLFEEAKKSLQELGRSGESLRKAKKEDGE